MELPKDSTRKYWMINQGRFIHIFSQICILLLVRTWCFYFATCTDFKKKGTIFQGTVYNFLMLKTQNKKRGAVLRRKETIYLGLWIFKYLKYLKLILELELQMMPNCKINPNDNEQRKVCFNYPGPSLSTVLVSTQIIRYKISTYRIL